MGEREWEREIDAYVHRNECVDRCTKGLPTDLDHWKKTSWCNWLHACKIKRERERKRKGHSRFDLVSLPRLLKACRVVDMNPISPAWYTYYTSDMYNFVVTMVINNVYEMHVHMDKRLFLRLDKNHQNKSHNSERRNERDEKRIRSFNWLTYGIFDFAARVLIFSVPFFTEGIATKSKREGRMKRTDRWLDAGLPPQITTETKAQTESGETNAKDR